MFSFFKSKKPSPTQIPAEAIPGAVPPAPREDEFIFIERRGQQPADDPSGTVSPGAGTAAATAGGGGGALYPAMSDVPVAGELGGNPVPVRQRSDEKVTGHALHGVPFRLSADVGQPADMEITRIQANEILAYVGQLMYAPNYDFTLERSVLQD